MLPFVYSFFEFLPLLLLAVALVVVDSGGTESRRSSLLPRYYPFESKKIRANNDGDTLVTSDSNSNPYSHLFESSNQTFILKNVKKIRKSASLTKSNPLIPQSSTQWVNGTKRTGLPPSSLFPPPPPKPKNRQVLVGYGKEPLNDSTLMATGSNVQPISIIHSNHHQQPLNSFGRHQPLIEQSTINQESIDNNNNIQQQQPLPYYQCNSIIQDNHFIIESPNYPAQYPSNQICSYYIGRNRSDVCQIELTISDMDIEDTAQCTADYLDLGIGAGSNRERLCGLMLRNTRRIINYPTNSSHIRITFHSDNKNDRPYRGFSAEVQQIPNSCNYGGNQSFTSGDGYGPGQLPSQFPIGTSGSPIGPGFPSDYMNPARGYKYPVVRPQQYPSPMPGYQPPYQVGSGGRGGGIGGPGSYYPQYPVNGGEASPGYYPQYPVSNGTSGSGGINTGYGQRLYPPSHPPYYNFRPGQNFPGGGGMGGYTPVPGQGQGPTIVYDGRPVPYPGGGSSKLPYDPSRQNGTSIGTVPSQLTPIYLASYCDVYLGELNGEIRSPGYPFGYPVNHTCVYTIKKASDDVCQIELVFHHFDVQTPNAQKDLTDNCQGDYLQMPDGGRLCGFYTQSMSGDYKLKKYYAFPETSEYVFMNFISDGQQTPDGSGFWIEVKQLPNTCSSNFDYRKARCDRVITGQYSTVERIYSPNYPQFYGPRQQCVYFIKPMDERTCEFELELVQFNLEQPTKQDNEECRKDFLQLPDRRRICGQQKFRQIFQFPKYHDRNAMMYFQSDDQIEDRGFEMIVRQIPNSCINNSNQVPGGQQPGPPTYNTNVYLPNNDPNMAYLPPTPVYTYGNGTDGLRPYQPPLRPPNVGPNVPYNSDFGPGTGGTTVIKSHPSGGSYGRKHLFPAPTPYPQMPPSQQLPSSYWNGDLPNVLNDPRNVDSSGTIPLYFANGTLATRIPPMKPVDMIPYLKKGKTVIQKGSTGRFLPTTIASPGDVNAILVNRYPEPESEIYQSSARLKKDGTSPTSTIFSDSPISNQPPAYNCDQIITRPVEYIRSPNFPNHYPVVTRCIYSIVKSDNSVCQIRVHLLSLDLEYTSGCRNDYLLIESTGEKLCGRISNPEVRTLNYYGYSRDIRVIFNSDRQITSFGFEVRIEQVPNSCDDLRSNSTLNSMIGARSFRNGDPLVTRTPDTTPLERLQTSDSPVPSMPVSAQALTDGNQTLPTTLIPTTIMMGGNRICQTTSTMENYFESENFPLEYPSNVNCVYKVFRANRNVCRIELDFEEFNVGDEIDSIGLIPSSSNQNGQYQERPIGECRNDFLEIDGIQYCGQRRGQQVAINFPKILNEIQFRFISANNGVTNRHFNGFRIKVKQVDINCRSSSLTSNEIEMEDEFSPAIIESCPKIGAGSTPSPNSTTSASPNNPTLGTLTLDKIDQGLVISEEVVKIQSPQFGVATSFQYEPFLDCHYVIQKANRNICSLEIRFEIFSLEESRSCSKDYLEINQMLRLCGKLPMDSIRVFDFFENRMLIHFHTDSDQNDQGFAIRIKQIRC